MTITSTLAALQDVSLKGKSALRLWIGLLLVVHFFGLLGMQWHALQTWLGSWTPFQSFAQLTPASLMLSALGLLWFERRWTGKVVSFLLISYAVGFGVEMAGVKTGVIFGHYWYGENLGWKWEGVPLVIGLNWAMLSYATGVMAARWASERWLRASISALLMVWLDVWMEPVAMQQDFWQWEGHYVPVQNYLAWFAVAWGLGYLFAHWQVARQNAMALPLYLVQLGFFIGQALAGI